MKRLYLTIFGLLLLTPLSAVSETLLIDSIMQQPPNTADGLMRPARGMTMTAVQQQFGEPEQKLAPQPQQ